MPKLREPHQSNTAPATQVVDRPQNAGLFQEGHQRAGGRLKGQQNHVSRSTREAILQGLEIAGNTMGRQGLISYIVAAARADFKYGVAMLGMVTPRTAHIDVTSCEQNFVSIADLDASLVAAGLPATREVFQLDYRSTAPEAEETEVVEGEEPPK